MRFVYCVLAAVLAATSPVHGQQANADLPPSVGDSAPENCVEVQIGTVKTFDCLNNKLKELSSDAPRVPNLPPLDARSREIGVGVVNVPAVRQQYGPNFGKSVIPYRPVPPSGTPRGP